jgi:hypothetical protein
MTELRAGIKLGLMVGQRGTKFSVLVEDTLKYSKGHHTEQRNYQIGTKGFISELLTQSMNELPLKQFLRDALVRAQAPGLILGASIYRAGLVDLMVSFPPDNPHRSRPLKRYFRLASVRVMPPNRFTPMLPDLSLRFSCTRPNRS